MAKLKGALQMTGNIGGMSIYKMKGCDELIVRVKGGATREQIETLESCKVVRQNNNEWRGVTQLAGAIRRSIKPIIGLSDYIFCGQLSALAKKIQKSDIGSVPGKRSLLLSTNRNLCTGFQLNREHSFRNTVLSDLSWKICRDNKMAQVNIGAITPACHIKGWSNAGKAFRFVLTLGTVSDYAISGDVYLPVNNSLPEFTTIKTTDWFPMTQDIEPRLVTLPAPTNRNTIIDDHTSFVLGIGIEFGNPGLTGEIQPDKVVGCAQILGVG